MKKKTNEEMNLDELTIPANKKLSPATERESKKNWDKLKAVMASKRAKKKLPAPPPGTQTLSNEAKEVLGSKDFFQKRHDRLQAGRAKRNADQVASIRKRESERQGTKKYLPQSDKKTTKESTALDRASMIIEKLSAENKAKREASRGTHSNGKPMRVGQNMANTKNFDRSNPGKPLSTMAVRPGYLEKSKYGRRAFNRKTQRAPFEMDPLKKKAILRSLKNESFDLIERLTGALKAKREANRTGNVERGGNRVGSKHVPGQPSNVLFRNRTKPHATRLLKSRALRPRPGSNKSERRQFQRDFSHYGVDSLKWNKHTRPNRANALRASKKKTNESFDLIERLTGALKAKREASRGKAGRVGLKKQNPQGPPKSDFSHYAPTYSAKRANPGAGKEGGRSHNRTAGGMLQKHDSTLKKRNTRFLRTKKANTPTYTARNSPKPQDIILSKTLNDYIGKSVKNRDERVKIKTESVNESFETFMNEGFNTHRKKTYQELGYTANQVRSMERKRIEKDKKAADHNLRPGGPYNGPVKKKTNESFDLIERLTGELKGKRERARGSEGREGSTIKHVDPTIINKRSRPKRAAQLKQAKFSRRMASKLIQNLSKPHKYSRVHEED